MSKHANFPLKTVENETILWSGKCVTNSTSNPDGLSKNITSVTRTAAGKFTVLLRDKFVQILRIDPPVLVGAAGYEVIVTSVDKDSAATGTITCDTKANTTDDDYFTLNDGKALYTVVLDVAGDGDGTGLGDIVVDISGDTTAADVSATLQAALAASTIQMTAVDATGSVTLTQDNVGAAGNTSQQGTQNLSNAWAVTNMTGGIDGVYGFKFETHAVSSDTAADTDDYDVYFGALFRNSKRTFR